MKVLVLCIDRDDDLGQKTGIEGPVIGRNENIRAALALGLADPEDADTNTILAAISTYDDLVKKEGISADIATLTGDVNVGYQSDIILTKQLEEALEVTGATSVVLVSNGAEDEYIFPMISSRTKVDSVRTVMVKQSKGIESTWYYIVKQFKDTKNRRKFIAPAGIILIALGLFPLIPMIKALIALDINLVLDELSAHGLAMISFVVGLILIQNAFRIREGFRGSVKRAKHSIYSGDVTIPMFIFAVIIFCLGLIKGYESVTANPAYDDVLSIVLLFMDGSFYWLIAAFLVNKSKNLINALVRREPVPRGFWVVSMSLVAIAFLVLGGVHYMLFILDVPTETSELLMYIEIGLGLAIAITGAIVQRQYSIEPPKRDGWRM